jgi:hypothetical protein
MFIMRYTITGDSLPVVICQLDPGEQMISESGGRTWMRGNVYTEQVSGGAKKALGRLFSGESLFMSLYTANSPCEIAFASSFPGRIVVRSLIPARASSARRALSLRQLGRRRAVDLFPEAARKGLLRRRGLHYAARYRPRRCVF